MAINQLDDPTLILGQTLILPDAVGRRSPSRTAPKPTSPSHGSHDSCTSCGGGTYGGGALRLARGRRQQLHQPVLPLRPLRHRHRGDVRLEGRGGGQGHRDLRRLEEQRRRLPGLDLARIRAVHDLQPHVVRFRSGGPVGRARPAGRAGRASPATPPARTATSRSGSARSGTAATGSTRSATSDRGTRPSAASRDQDAGAARPRRPGRPAMARGKIGPMFLDQRQDPRARRCRR